MKKYKELRIFLNKILLSFALRSEINFWINFVQKTKKSTNTLFRRRNKTVITIWKEKLMRKAERVKYIIQ